MNLYQFVTTQFTAPEIRLCREWIRLYCHPIKSIQKEYSSYALKHIVEYWSTSIGERNYIYEGSFIRAAHLEGYTYEDGYFNMCIPHLSLWDKLRHMLFH